MFKNQFLAKDRGSLTEIADIRSLVPRAHISEKRDFTSNLNRLASLRARSVRLRCFTTWIKVFSVQAFRKLPAIAAKEEIFERLVCVQTSKTGRLVLQGYERDEISRPIGHVVQQQTGASTSFYLELSSDISSLWWKKDDRL
jgi:hypothetical protein